MIGTVIYPGGDDKTNKRYGPPYDLPPYEPVRIIKKSFSYGYGSAGDHYYADYGQDQSNDEYKIVLYVDPEYAVPFSLLFFHGPGC